MSVAERLPAPPRGLGAGFVVAGIVLAVLIALVALVQAVQQRDELADVRRVAVASQRAAVANQDGLKKANARLEAAGKAPVPVPSVPAGVSGATGPAGAAGLPGTNGANGLNGQAGDDGSDGSTGLPGSAGPAGPGAAGQNGATGPAGHDGEPGADGSDGTNGSDGSDGTDGQPPTSWTYTVFGQDYTCTRDDDFDPDQPRYDCTADAP